MRTTLHLAAFALLLTATAHAQITNPNNLISPPPPNPARHALKPINDLQWLWQFAKPAPAGEPDRLRNDARFQTLLEENFKQPQAMWGYHAPLNTTIGLFLSGNGQVTTQANRYLTVDGCVPGWCPAHGLLWIDLGTAHPLMVFAAVNWTTQNHPTDDAVADYNLWIFSSQTLVADELPLALTEAIAHWDARLATAHRLVPHISNAVLVEPDGEPVTLTPSLTGANTIAPQPDTRQAQGSKLSVHN